MGLYKLQRIKVLTVISETTNTGEYHSDLEPADFLAKPKQKTHHNTDG